MSSPSEASFSSNERLILASWFEGVDCDDRCDRPEVGRALDDRGYTEPVNFIYTRHQAAVAGIVLERYQDRLIFQPEARRVVSDAIQRAREPEASEAGSHRRATVRRLFTVWWSGGPGGAWGSLYCLTWLPEFERFVVTDSTDDDEPYQHADFAIGHFGPCADEHAAAMEVIGHQWRLRRDVSVDDEATVVSVQSEAVAESLVRQWLEAVWTLRDEDEDDAEEGDEDGDEAWDAPEEDTN